MTKVFDLAVIGGGILGASTALFCARGGMRVVLLEKDRLCRGASGVNAGTLTLQMTRAALIPYAMNSYEMWKTAKDWLGHDVGVVACEGLSLAFTEDEEALLTDRAKARREAGAKIDLITGRQALRIEPGLSESVRVAGYCATDGFANAYLTGLAYKRSLHDAAVELRENTTVTGLEAGSDAYEISTEKEIIKSRRVVLAGGVWLEPMLKWLGITLPIKTLVNQLAVTERRPKVMRTVVGVASGLLSLKQYPHGSVVIGGGWQGTGDRSSSQNYLNPDSLIGNMRLAAYAIPALAKARFVRAWAGYEAETSDAMPVVGPIPGFPDAYICGSIHSGYTSGPYVSHLLSEKILGREPKMPLFPIERLITSTRTNATSSLGHQQ